MKRKETNKFRWSSTKAPLIGTCYIGNRNHEVKYFIIVHVGDEFYALFWIYIRIDGVSCENLDLKGPREGELFSLRNDEVAVVRCI